MNDEYKELIKRNGNEKEDLQKKYAKNISDLEKQIKNNEELCNEVDNVKKDKVQLEKKLSENIKLKENKDLEIRKLQEENHRMK